MDERPGFWRRQFGDPATLPQVVFDMVCGMFLPVLCLTLDPFVFKNGFQGRPWSPYGGLAYAFIAVEIVVLTLWLLPPRNSPWKAAVLAGPLLAGALASLALGIALLPLSLVGIVAAGIGLLGFTPLATGIVYLRNHLRACRASRGAAPMIVRLTIGLLLAAAPILAALAAQREAVRAIDGLIARPDSPRQLWLARHFGQPRFAELPLEWEKERDPDRKLRLAKAYQTLTGRTVEDALALMRD